MLADASVASSHCSATLTVAFKNLIRSSENFETLGDFTQERMGLFGGCLIPEARLKTILPPGVVCPTLLVGGWQAVPCQLVDSVYQLTCCCPPTVHLNPRQQPQRASITNRIKKKQHGGFQSGYFTLGKKNVFQSVKPAATFSLNRQLSDHWVIQPQHLIPIQAKCWGLLPCILQCPCSYTCDSNQYLIIKPDNEPMRTKETLDQRHMILKNSVIS